MQLSYNSEIADAKSRGKPILALESTIIAHGFSYPGNLQLAREMEQEVRDAGAVPATIAILDGEIKIGLADAELERIATDRQIHKVSARDIAYFTSQGLSGATTVASTIRLARLAGIQVFATGGIGGAHRGSQKSWDVSADLDELAHQEMLLISAGAKAILDLGLTLEILESRNVPVIGYKTEFFPAFYSRTSPHRLDQQVNSAEDAASLAIHHWAVGGKGILLANPIPTVSEIPAKEIDQIITTALEAAGPIQGKKVTPFLLAKINELTAGRSQIANRALALNNARLGAKIAVAFNSQRNRSKIET